MRTGNVILTYKLSTLDGWESLSLRATLLSLSNLGLTLQKQEKWPEAESVF